MAALTLAAMLVAVSPAEQQERYDVGLETLQREVARYDATTRDYERRIRAEQDDDKRNDLRERLLTYCSGAGAMLEGIWLEVEAMRRKVTRVRAEAV